MAAIPGQFHKVENDPEVRTLVDAADDRLRALGLNEHGFPHVRRVGLVASNILRKLGFEDRIQEQARIAALLHDIGNAISRRHHASTGAILADAILSRLGVPPGHVNVITGAIGCHRDDHGRPEVATDAVLAALIIADKADVHRSRVRQRHSTGMDLHDRVGYSVVSSRMLVDRESRTLRLEIVQDVSVATSRELEDLFSIQWKMCRQAAEILGCSFTIGISEVASH